jgi:hypothetical protein
VLAIVVFVRLNEDNKIVGQFVIAGSDTAEAFEAVDEKFDEVARWYCSW